MAGRLPTRAKGIRALMALGVVLAYPAYSTLACTLAADDEPRAIAISEGSAPSEKAKSDRDCQKREGQRSSSSKPCPDGGERLPQDRRRSPLDTLPPLAPLVA